MSLTPEDSKALEIFGAEVRRHVDDQFQKSQNDLLELIGDLQDQVRAMQTQIRAMNLRKQDDE